MHILLLFLTISATAQEFNSSVPNSVIIILSTKNYSIARKFANAAVKKEKTAIDLKAVVGQGPVAAACRAFPYGERRALLSVCGADASAAGARNASLSARLKVPGLRRAAGAPLSFA